MRFQDFLAFSLHWAICCAVHKGKGKLKMTDDTVIRYGKSVSLKDYKFRKLQELRKDGPKYLEAKRQAKRDKWADEFFGR